MDIKSLNFDEQLIQLIERLQLKVELFEGQRIRATKSVDELTTLMRVASSAKKDEVKELYVHIINSLDQEKYFFFKTLGVNVEAHRTVAPSAEPAEAPAPQERKGKRKIIYRGQETWV